VLRCAGGGTGICLGFGTSSRCIVSHVPDTIEMPVDISIFQPVLMPPLPFLDLSASAPLTDRSKQQERSRLVHSPTI